MSRFTLELAKAATGSPHIEALVSVSRSTEMFASFEQFGPALVPVSTYSHGAGALAAAWRIPTLRRLIWRVVVDHRVDAVVNLMPHVWTPFIAPVVKSSGVPYVVIAHDATRHPGDRRGWVHGWLGRDLAQADVIVTLSAAVRQSLQRQGIAPPGGFRELFHPHFGNATRAAKPRGDGPLRLLFFGRILRYKGLSLFVDTLERLRARGVPFEACVAGEGTLGPEEERLRRLGAAIHNRWIGEAEVAQIVEASDVVVLSHIEASQSGVAALALGFGIPVVATPVGALGEQVAHGRTGLVAQRVDAEALADELTRLATEPGLMESLVAGIDDARRAHSVDRFLAELIEICASVPRSRRIT